MSTKFLEEHGTGSGHWHAPRNVPLKVFDRFLEGLCGPHHMEINQKFRTGLINDPSLEE
jgi:hypothetical protein